MLPVLSFTVQANRTEGTSNKWAFLLKVIRLIGLGDKTGINQLLGNEKCQEEANNLFHFFQYYSTLKV